MQESDIIVGLSQAVADTGGTAARSNQGEGMLKPNSIEGTGLGSNIIEGLGLPENTEGGHVHRGEGEGDLYNGKTPGMKPDIIVGTVLESNIIEGFMPCGITEEEEIVRERIRRCILDLVHGVKADRGKTRKQRRAAVALLWELFRGLGIVQAQGILELLWKSCS